MGDAAVWASTASNKFREVQRTSTNPTTKLLAEGLEALAAAVRELDQQLEKRQKHIGQ
ncbi:MAG: hypothetical protein QOH60_3731 [Mycobacterium sp.]|jgi:Tfp pilus assembly protein FimV|nr:hypothetical protein [Mycobacterium sp.]